MASGKKLLGAVLTGYAGGLAQQAKQAREDQLMRLKRRWAVEDREDAQDFTREGWDQQAGEKEKDRSMTREGWDRQDDRASAERDWRSGESDKDRGFRSAESAEDRAWRTSEAEQGRYHAREGWEFQRESADDTLETVVGEDGKPVRTRRRDAVGKSPVLTTKSGGKVSYATVKDPDSGKVIYMPKAEAARRGMEAASPPKDGKRFVDVYTADGERQTMRASDAERMFAQEAQADEETEVLARVEESVDSLDIGWLQSWRNRLGVDKDEFVRRLGRKVMDNPGRQVDDLRDELLSELESTEEGSGGDTSGDRPAGRGGQPAAGGGQGTQGGAASPELPPGLPDSARWSAKRGAWFVPRPDGQGWMMAVPRGGSG